MSLPTLNDLKAHANLPASDNSNDTELTDMLEAAVDVVEGIVGPLSAQMVTETHRSLSSDVLVLNRVPVVDLVSVSSRSGATLTPLVATDYELDADAGLLHRADGGWFSGSYTVRYSTGRPTVPAAIRLAILIIAAHLFETQRMPGQSADSAPAGFGGVDGVPDSGASGLGYAIPRRAEELLRRYMTSRIA